jgi:hypothetical protein
MLRPYGGFCPHAATRRARHWGEDKRRPYKPALSSGRGANAAEMLMATSSIR